jgi:hypothetical protein
VAAAGPDAQHNNLSAAPSAPAVSTSDQGPCLVKALAGTKFRSYDSVYLGTSAVCSDGAVDAESHGDLVASNNLPTISLAQEQMSMKYLEIIKGYAKSHPELPISSNGIPVDPPPIDYVNGELARQGFSWRVLYPRPGIVRFNPKP